MFFLSIHLKKHSWKFSPIGFYAFSIFSVAFFAQCRPQEFQNPCDPRSSNFLLRLIVQFQTKDSTPQCGISVYPRISGIESPYNGKDNWLDYIKNDGKDILSASNIDCDGTETGGYASCLHVGEIRRVKLSGGIFFDDPCEHLRAEDSEGAFQFTCISDSNGVSLTTVSMQDGKRFGDLILSTNPPTFKPLRIFVFQDNALIGKTEEVVWWKNPIQTLPTSGGSLNRSSNVYFIPNSTNISSLLTIDANKVAIASKSDAEVRLVGGITVNGTFAYVEGAFYGNAGGELLKTNPSASFLFFRESVLSQQIGSNIFDLSSSNARIKRIYLQGFGSSSIAFNSTATTNNIENNYVSDLVIGNSDASRFFLGSSTAGKRQTNHVFTNLLIHGGTDEPFFLQTSNGGLSEGNSFRDTNSINSYNGFTLSQTLSNGIQNTSFINLISFNSGGDLSIASTLQTNAGLAFENLAFANTGGSPIYIESVNGSVFSGKLILDSVNTCTVTGTVTTPGITNTSCQPRDNSNFSLSRISDLSTAFVGQVFQNDQKNAFDTDGFITSIPANNPLSQSSFENSFRTWGINNNGVYNVSTRGGCSAGCRIDDWSLKKTNNIIRNVNSCPDGSDTMTQIFYGTGASDNACSSYMRGSKATSNGKCESVHLRNARELMFDGKGNDNGYCESNEDCLYTPNIGAYQGHGKIVRAKLGNPKYCDDIGTGGKVQNVRIFQYESNGY